ncbi:MAG: ATP-binding protein [Pirellulales bacterium]|nr:ATP-binding protein [Pirellulales bacterium]
MQRPRGKCDAKRTPLPTSCPRRPQAFASDGALLDAAVRLFGSRQAVLRAEQDPATARDRWLAVCRQARDWERYWHESFERARPGPALVERCRRHRLGRLEREIVAALAGQRLALVNTEAQNCAQLIGLMGLQGRKKLAALRAFAETGRLFRSKIITFDDVYEDVVERQPILDPVLVETVLAPRSQRGGGWDLTRETQLYERLPGLTRVLMRKGDEIWNVLRGWGETGSVFRWARKAERLLGKFTATLKRNPEWKLAQAAQRLAEVEFAIMLALLGKRLGYLHAEESLFTGGGLARAVSQNADEVQTNLNWLSPSATLVRDNWIRPCGGSGEMATDDPAGWEATEYELTEKTTEALGIQQQMRKGRFGEYCSRTPRIRLEQLVHSDRVRQALEMVLAQMRHGPRLIEAWGLKELIPYGCGATVLFSGPPGTGKTATAEALAYELGKPLLVVDYSRVQNCFVGQTEKNIVRAFREAKTQEAVLFWDEADAMFYDRDQARHPWEVRDVNVLLQQIEQFEGVCILATNRKVTLDKALQRRIALKVEFDRPNRHERRQIWEKLLPKKLPILPEVELDRLCEAELSGGEIKNVVLNAARLAWKRDPAGPLSASDFHEALVLERRGGWGSNVNRIGFER